MLLSAQTSTSRITGTVTDSTGAVVAGATVTAKNEATGVTQTQVTTDSGLYAFTSLPVGAYTVSVERQGFKTAQRTNNQLLVNTPLSVDMVLEAGNVSEVVTVQGGAEQLQTSNATIGNVVEQKAIEQLPLNGRNPLTLLVYEPGVVQRSAGGAGSGIHVNGSRDRAFNVTIDGIEANESSVPNPVSNLYRLNPDNVQEFKVTTNNATAEEGRNSGASISVRTRSGTNELHGNAFYFHRNDALNSKEFFANALNQPKQIIKLHQFGGEAGGPVIRDKTFFFGSYQMNRVSFTQAIDQTFGVPIVYTGLARQGIFRYFVPDPANPLVINGTTITRNSRLLVDSSTGNLVSGVSLCSTPTQLRCVRTYNVLDPANNTGGRTFDQSVAALINRYPAPNNFNVGGDGLNTGAYLWNPPTKIKGPAYMARIDHTFNQSNSIFGRYLFSDYNTLEGDPLNGRPQVFPGFAPLGEVYRRTSGLALNYRHVFSPYITNEVTVGYGRFQFLFTQGEANPDFPNVPPFDFNNLSEPYNNTPRTARAVTTPQILDNLTVVRGAHVIGAGANIRVYRHVDQRGQPGGINVTPAIDFAPSRRNPFAAGGGFTTAANIDTTTDITTLRGLINNVFGLPARIQQTFISNLNQDVFLPFKVGDQVTLFAEQHKLNQFNFYAQDEWKARQNLTLSYGLRWEINPAATTVGGSVLRPTTAITNQTVTFAPADTWYDTTKLGVFGPRLGLAWSPAFKSGPFKSLFGTNSRSVIRLGYGIAYDTISSFQVTAAAGRVPGLLVTCSSTFNNTTQTFSTATNGCVPPTSTSLAGGFPLLLSPPTTKPSSFLTLPVQTVNNAPPVTVFAPEMKVPTVHQWNVSFQRELPGGFVGQMAYVGRAGNRLFMAYNINQINSDPILPSFLLLQENVRRGCNPAGTVCVGGATPIPASQIPLIGQLNALGGGTAGVTFVNSDDVVGDLRLNAAGATVDRIEQNAAFLPLRLRRNQQFSTITYLDNSGASNYHSAQFTLRKRFAAGLGLSAAYTFGKSIDNQSVDPVGAASGGGLSQTNSRTPTDIRNFREERARSDFDRRHVFTMTSSWEVPVGKGRRFLADSPGIVKTLLGDWSINGIFNAMSGEPFSVRSGARTSNSAHESRAAVLNFVQPELQDLPNVRGPVLFPNANNFALPQPGTNGAGRNIFTAPGYWNLDLSFIKFFNVTERLRVQFRTEMFNALNHANFDNPRDASVGSPSFRSDVFGQTCCAAVAPPSAQTIIQTGESSRVIQFGLKIQF
ncbi:MAG: carboxypeptidase-like regulatory domain-containing protein [Acidobacteria bacterium]|nr:carboxypeptidase-like regulatory domain-containing protein [Acidobacteriota bacterium]